MKNLQKHDKLGGNYVSSKQLNITDDYNDHKKRIDGILKQIKIIKNLKYSIKEKTWRAPSFPTKEIREKEG